MSADQPEALQVASLVVRVLRELAVEYHVGGSYASAVHGIPRQTHDVDLVVDLRPGLHRDFARALEGSFHIDEEAVCRAVRERSSFNIIHFATGIKVDLFVKGSSSFDESEFARSIRVQLGDAAGTEMFVKSAEDTILRKLQWFRLGGEVSDRQWQDVSGIVGVQGDGLDTEYLREWADRLEIRDLLDKVLP